MWPNTNSGANGLNVVCRGPGRDGTEIAELEESAMYPYTTPGHMASGCPSGSAVCGLSSKIQPDQGLTVDDVGLTDAKMQCCA